MTETQSSMSSMLKNKGTEKINLRLLRAQLLVRRRVSVKSILFIGFGNHNENKNRNFKYKEYKTDSYIKC
jgi:hypothetical protein